ncbi:hypothetical protein [Mammaliicoccus sciuri]
MKTWKLISILLFIVTMFILNQSITFATEVINNSEDSTVLSNSKGQPIEINEKVDTITVKNIESNDDKSVIASAENNNPTYTKNPIIPNTNGNSIVTLYNEANKLSLFYQIVKHGTYEENPVLVNFISTDIDAAQGVESNLSNLGE